MAEEGTATLERENPSHCPTACSGCFTNLLTLSAAPKKAPACLPPSQSQCGVSAGEEDGDGGLEGGSRRGELMNSKQS